MEKTPAVTSKGLVLAHADATHYGFLKVVADAQQVQIQFHALPGQGGGTVPPDIVTVRLGDHTLIPA